MLELRGLKRWSWELKGDEVRLREVGLRVGLGGETAGKSPNKSFCDNPMVEVSISEIFFRCLIRIS
jgi:hypothetical protein